METVAVCSKNYTKRDISVNIAIRLWVRRWMNWSSIHYSGQRHFSSSRLSDRISDPPSPMVSGNTFIDVNMVVREAKTSSQFTVEMKNAWRLGPVWAETRVQSGDWYGLWYAAS